MNGAMNCPLKSLSCFSHFDAPSPCFPPFSRILTLPSIQSLHHTLFFIPHISLPASRVAMGMSTAGTVPQATTRCIEEVMAKEEGRRATMGMSALDQWPTSRLQDSRRQEGDARSNEDQRRDLPAPPVSFRSTAAIP